MKVQPLIADTGRPNGVGSTTVNLLNAGWTATMALPHPAGGYTLLNQALAVFVEADWDQLNRPHSLVVELHDEEGGIVELVDPDEGTLKPARIEQEITIPPVPMAPNGTPSHVFFLFDFPPGSLRIPAPRRRYIWRATVGQTSGETGFWVLPQPQEPRIGNPGGSSLT